MKRIFLKSHVTIVTWQGMWKVNLHEETKAIKERFLKVDIKRENNKNKRERHNVTDKLGKEHVHDVMMCYTRTWVIITLDKCEINDPTSYPT